MLQKFDGNPSFELVADLDRKGTPGYDRTAVYLIDRDGVVRQVFPATIRNRPDWAAVLNEIEGTEKGAVSRPAR